MRWVLVSVNIAAAMLAIVFASDKFLWVVAASLLVSFPVYRLVESLLADGETRSE